ncbi:MAG: hypothetical protein Kow0040_32680 [Thermogutta sp.]
MAGDWIPVSVDLPFKPEVCAIAEATRRSPDEVVGLLIRLWAWAQAHSTDGTFPGSTPVTLAKCARIPTSFVRAVVASGWLEADEAGVRIPRFDRWLSHAAKRRFTEREKKRRQRRGEAAAGEGGLTTLPVVSRSCPDRIGTTKQKKGENIIDDDDDEKHRGKGGLGGKPDPDQSRNAADRGARTAEHPDQELPVRRVFEHFGRMWGRAGPSVKRDRVLLWRLCAAACGGSDWAKTVLETAISAAPRNPGAYLQRLILEIAPKSPNPAVWLRRFQTPYDAAAQPPARPTAPPPETLDPPASPEEVRAILREAIKAVRCNGPAKTT